MAQPRHPLTGKQFRVSGRTKAELDTYLGYVARLREELRLGVKSPDDVDRQLRRLQHGLVTVERAARGYIDDGGIAPNTRRRVASFLAGVGAPLARLELEILDGPQLEAWIKSAPMRKHTHSSVISYWRVLRAVVRHAASRGWIARVPWGSWRPRLQPAGYAPGRGTREAARSAEELAQLLDAAVLVDEERDARGALPDVEAKMACAAYAGLRQGELAGLRWSDVDPARGVFLVERQGGRDRTKQGGPPKELRVAPELLELLERFRRRLEAAELYAPRGPVFPSTTRSRYEPRPYAARSECLPNALVRAVAERAGLPHPARWSAHSLRDTFATLEALAHAGDLEAVRDRTRHASIASLLRYLRSRGREPAPPGFSLPERRVPRLAR